MLDFEVPWWLNNDPEPQDPQPVNVFNPALASALASQFTAEVIANPSTFESESEESESVSVPASVEPESVEAEPAPRPEVISISSSSSDASTVDYEQYVRNRDKARAVYGFDGPPSWWHYWEERKVAGPAIGGPVPNDEAAILRAEEAEREMSPPDEPDPEPVLPPVVPEPEVEELHEIEFPMEDENLGDQFERVLEVPEYETDSDFSQEEDEADDDSEDPEDYPDSCLPNVIIPGDWQDDYTEFEDFWSPRLQDAPFIRSRHVSLIVSSGFSISILTSVAELPRR
jgi:hypothetical protein